jgi:hypothetical protein
VTSGNLNNQYGIVGTNLATTDSILLNGLSVYFQPALVTNTLIIVTLPTNLPYGPGQNNTLVVVTRYGRTSFNFPINQPSPNITSFTPQSGSTGGTVTITGSIFDNLMSVKFGTVPAQIVSSTSTSIVVTVPAGIPSSSNIFVTTLGGTTESATQFSLLLYKSNVYTDILATGWTFDDYNGAVTTNSANNPEAGDSALQTVFGTSYSAFRLEYNGGPYGSGPYLDVAGLGLTTLKISIRGDNLEPNGSKVSISLNNNYSNTMVVTIQQGTYTDFAIPLSAFGSPTNISQIVVQEYSGIASGTIYIDDLGFN